MYLSSANALDLDQSKILSFGEELINPFPNDKFWTLPNRKGLQKTISNLTKMAECFPNR